MIRVPVGKVITFRKKGKVITFKKKKTSGQFSTPAGKEVVADQNPDDSVLKYYY